MSRMSRSEAPRSESPGETLTYDDFALFPDDGKRHELIDAEHYMTPSPNTKHQTIAVNLTGLIWSYLQERRIGRLIVLAPQVRHFAREP